ncbi:MAG: glycoside hydrolase family 127 protein [Clostridia bacterium]|nr:glycoside hydrolase family 127 protein [Clostridia bacterium]
MENISFDKVKIKKSMWYDLQKINGEKTINSVRNRFAETGRFDAFKCDWKEGMDKKPHFFWDSDVAKWIEGVAYIVTGNRNDELEKYVDDLVDLVEKNQHKNGYFNIFYTVCDPGKEWTQRKNHELYCAGHLIEAAIAYKKATKKDKLLKCMIKYADYIYKVFVEEKSASFVTCGHEEIELALVRLFYETNNKKYLDLAQFFIDMRGNNDKDFNADVSYEERAYDQSHLPVRKQFTAEGHAVRGCYLYSAMADLAKINSDKELFDACKSIFNNITEKRMYVTGGIGSSRIKEAFTIDYDLPNQYAYSESCAAISLAMFANRMLKLENNRIYSDIIEKIIYNAGISGISLSGNKFFYENPLSFGRKLNRQEEKFLETYGRKLPIRERVEVFECSCCPPNINRFFASIGDYICTQSDDTIFIHQFINSEINFDDNTILAIETDYPKNGSIKITYNGSKKISVRLPSWCENHQTSKKYTLENGYMNFGNIQDVTMDFEMKPVLVRACSKVYDDSGKVAVMYGPVVFCAEAVDNGDNLGDVSILTDGNFEIEKDDFTNFYAITADGKRLEEQTELYSKYIDNARKCKIKLIPYYAFANRGDSEMQVWLNVR